MICANCGNSDPRTLHDEGDTFYCSVCGHRTQTATGQDDLITCPYCGRFRDRKAFSCWWCNHSLNEDSPPSKEEYLELDELLTDFENRMGDNIRYSRIRNKKKQ